MNGEEKCDVTVDGTAAHRSLAPREHRCHNYGPNTMQSSTWWIEYVAPGGTQFHAAQQFFDCIEVVALTDYRCSGGQLFVDDPANYEGTCCNRVDIKLTIVGPVTSPARVTVDYPDDPNSSNDSATLSINPHAVTPTVGASPAAPTAAPGSPAPARSSRSSAAARPSGFSAAPTSAALGDSPGASATTDAPAGGVPATLPSATPRLASGSHSGGAAVVFWIVVAVVFVGAAAAGSLFLIRRRRTT